MKTLKKKRRVQIIAIAALALVAATALVGYGMRDGINFFRAPSEVLAEPPAPTEVFRIGGLVEAGTLERGQGEEVRFMVTDGGASVPVVSHARLTRAVRATQRTERFPVTASVRT